MKKQKFKYLSYIFWALIMYLVLVTCIGLNKANAQTAYEVKVWGNVEVNDSIHTYEFRIGYNSCRRAIKLSKYFDSIRDDMKLIALIENKSVFYSFK